MYRLENFDPEHFLTHHWQKKPLVIRQAFSEFQDPLDENELAGLAQEIEIDSRIVSKQANKWSVHQGPFEDFTPLTLGEWTLLVQGVDSYVAAAAELVQAFSFIPNWRIDDLMASFSVAGAGVGPHLDQYDVFIIQGKGSRRWQVGSTGQHEECLPAPQLKQISHFEPIIDEVLLPGDMIYIPPGFPHNGVALNDCMNYSVGFRAPTQKELISDFADFALDREDFNLRYQDPDIQMRQSTSEIKQQEVKKLRALMKDMIVSVHFEHWLGRFLTKTDGQEEYPLEPEDTYTIEEVKQLIISQTHFVKALGVKSLIIEPEIESHSEVLVYVNESVFHVPKNLLKHVSFLLDQPSWQTNSEINYENSIFFIQFMTTLVNKGYWYPE